MICRGCCIAFFLLALCCFLEFYFPRKNWEYLGEHEGQAQIVISWMTDILNVFLQKSQVKVHVCFNYITLPLLKMEIIQVFLYFILFGLLAQAAGVVSESLLLFRAVITYSWLPLNPEMAVV